MRLTDGEFINDNIIDLQLKRIVLWKKHYELNLDKLRGYTDRELWKEFDKWDHATTVTMLNTSEGKNPNEISFTSDHNTSPIYAFSSMFYTKLTEGRSADAYELVKKWTKNVDIFSKEFILIPINYASHWSLVCVVRPGFSPCEVS
jgi:Ulp1 family protease